MNEDNLKKALTLYFSPNLGRVKSKEIVEKNLWDSIDFKDSEIQKKVDRELLQVEKFKAKIISLLDDEYPSQLKEIYDAPLVLYYYGNLKTSLPIGVVGTRNPSKYGERACKEIVRELCQYPVEIISGFANGIDTIAHREAVSANAKTFAVMGCGLDKNYPASNYRLRAEILEKGGALISEFPFGTEALSYHFPLRNRIISGLSVGVAVIEASASSGAIITAKTANEQGRNIYTIPGSIFCDSFDGNHALIRQGATLIQSGKDILNDISVFKEEKPQLKKLKKASPKKEPHQEKLLPLFGEEEKLVYDFICEPVTLDFILAKTGFTPAKALSLLTQLCIKGAAEERGGLYHRT